MSDDGFALRLDGVTKKFGKHTAVDSFDFEVPRGVICGLLGPNGSGKTTSIRMIMGILGPDEGTVSLYGEDPNVTRRTKVGYLPEERGVYKKMKCLELITFLGEIRGLTRAEARRRGGGWLDRLGLPEWADKKVEDLSKGMQQKIQFISTVIHEPELLILDEPFSGLDPINQDVLEEIVRDYHAKGTTILFSTHLMDQAERLCERVCLISNSKKVLDGDLKEIKAAERRGIVAVEFEGTDTWIEGPEVDHVEQADDGLHLILRDGEDHQPILSRAVNAGARILRFDLVEPRLHEIFVRHAGDGAVGDAGMPSGARMSSWNEHVGPGGV
ncbi:MAG: ATP-binding cassette domain-containing protein [Gemmatimonadota bacterium]|nr:ATP-binding cassette domain-containing protein [Gemmatimonadota bacterium]MDE3005432.1 ATP-binding cassette domain-containing protein [Gemmatimonadota bacterium]MDE3012520.1 ATP-binding cassette domain-containing protein [Gemmatimonadota bacterium]